MLEQFAHSEPHRTRGKDNKRESLHTLIKKEERRGGRDGHWIATRALWSSAIAVTTISSLNSWAPLSQFEVDNTSQVVPDHVWLRIPELHFSVATCVTSWILSTLVNILNSRTYARLVDISKSRLKFGLIKPSYYISLVPSISPIKPGTICKVKANRYPLAIYLFSDIHNSF